ncbi:MAG: hypothetical protein COB85_05150 [Bacteroidetes bacterium]|nr:MAG: hypothetical protein COB85_05150 [Bacteroidota bacterium]
MSERIKLLALSTLLFGSLLLVYSNHFHNVFQFDDFHSIVNNEYVMDLGNVVLFFTDGSTITTNVSNQSYRPVVTLMNAIDYWMGGAMDPFYFHLSIFFWFVVLGICLFFFFSKVFATAELYTNASFIAIFATAWFMLLTANAETINYIGARSDSFSTLCVVGSFLLYFNQRTRKYFLYLLPMLLGIYTKQTGVMFVALLCVYIYLFEENRSVSDLLSFKRVKSILNTFKKAAVAIVIGCSVFLFNQFYMTPGTTTKWDTSVSKFDYFTTQFYVILHYLGNFILPTNLSADPDVEIITPFYDKSIVLGLIVILGLLFLAIKYSKKRETRPIAFGILWFFIALIPTSSLLPRFQIANDHRTFFPYIGLVLSFSWYVAIQLKDYSVLLNKTRLAVYLIPLLAASIIAAYGYGAHERNKVWSTGESLWYDVTIKSPNNGRGMMNYGLALMSRGDYEGAYEYFQRAEEKLPNWSYLHINLAIVRNAMGYPDEAENYFRQALSIDPNNVECYFFYANWLVKLNRNDEAKSLLLKGQQLSPAHTKIISLLSKLDNIPDIENESSLPFLLESANEFPTPENYLKLSLAFYHNGEYKECIKACQKALDKNQNYAAAYNNICSAYNKLEQWEKAIAACQSALDINPEFELAKGNRSWALDELEKLK